MHTPGRSHVCSQALGASPPAIEYMLSHESIAQRMPKQCSTLCAQEQNTICLCMPSFIDLLTARTVVDTHA